VEAEQFLQGEVFGAEGEGEALVGEGLFEGGGVGFGEVVFEGVAEGLAAVREDAGEEGLELGDSGEGLYAIDLRGDGDEGGGDFGRGPEGAGGDLAEDLHRGQGLDEDAQGAVVAGIGSGGHALGDFPLDGEGEAGEKEGEGIFDF